MFLCNFISWNTWNQIKSVEYWHSSVYSLNQLMRGRYLFPQLQFSSVTQSCLTLQHHESQHTRPPCLSPTPGVHSDSCPSSQWCHPAILSFSSCPQSLSAAESFPMNQLFSWGGQGIGVSALASFLPKNPRADLLAGQGTLKSLLQHHSSKALILRRSAFFTVQFSHPHMTTGKTIALTRWTLVGKVMSLLLNIRPSNKM